MRPSEPRRFLAPGLVLLLVVAPLAGCLAPDESLGATSVPLDPEGLDALLSQPVFDVLVYEEVALEASDGVTLWMNVVRPDVSGPDLAADGVPVIVVMTPYMTTQDLFDQAYHGPLTQYFAPRGYAVASVAVRGTHNSGGCLDQTSRRQAQDGYEAVEHLAAMEWSNGNVGMIGASYDGETQISTATLAPPSLKAIVPIASITSQYLWFYKGGIPYERQWYGMTSYMLTGLRPPTSLETLPEYPNKVPCHVENHQEAMRSEGDWSPYWEDRYYKEAAKDIEAAVLYVHGLQDWNVKPDAIPGFYEDVRAPKRAVLGQWAHAVPTRADWMLLVHRWFDHFLLGVDTGVLDERPVWIEDSLGRWREEEDWPPPVCGVSADTEQQGNKACAQPLTLYARRDTYTAARTLDPRPPRADEPSESFFDVPNAPFAPPAAGLRYVSHPLLEDLHVSGVPEFVVEGASSAKETHWVAHLQDVAPDGTTRTVLRGFLNARYHETGDPRTASGNGADLVPGEPYTFRLDTFPLDHVFRAGHRIAWLVTSDDEWTQQDTTFATNRVFHDAERPTRLVLPVIERGPEVFVQPPHVEV